MISEALYHDPAVQNALRESGEVLEPFEVSLKGLSDSFKLWRIWPKLAASQKTLTR